MNKTSMAFGAGFGGDGGFWMFGPDGKLHWVPPWNPELSRDFTIATGLASMAAQIKDSAMRAQVIGIAQGIAQVHAKEISQHTRAATQ